MSQWFYPWQLSRPLFIHQVPNSSKTLERGVSWGTRGLKDLTETDSTISRPWTSPSPDNHSQLATAGRGMGLLFFSLAREKWNKCPSLTHSAPSRTAGFFFEDEQAGTERQRENIIQSEVKWARFDSEGAGSLQSDVTGWHEKLTDLRRWCMNSYERKNNRKTQSNPIRNTVRMQLSLY